MSRRRIVLRRSCLLLIVCSAVLAMAGIAAQPWIRTGRLVSAPPASADPGPRVADCRSALRLGWTRCASRKDWIREMLHQRRIDTEVAAFLADYGKPPREAVRALLDPTDENIAAWMQAQQKTLAISAYVAQRLTALQERQQKLEQTDHDGSFVPTRSFGVHP